MIKCGECGRFISWKDAEARTYTYFGGPCSTEPPDPEFVCGRCWNKKAQEQLEQLKKICWMGPSYMNSIEQLSELGEL